MRFPRFKPLARRLSLSGVAKGIRIPESPANRYQEFFHLKELLELQSINCVIDVGANTGQFASDLRAMGYQGLIRSFEPVERAFLPLEAKFRADPRWRGYRMALGSENTRMTINVIPSLTEMSSLLAPRGEWSGIEEEDVEVRRLDELADEILSSVSEPRVFLKMDTQGYDLEVFEGAGGCIEQIHGLQSELSVVPLYNGMPSYLEALSAYQQAGFGLTHLSVVSRGPTHELQELNCFMKRNASADS